MNSIKNGMMLNKKRKKKKKKKEVLEIWLRYTLVLKL